MKSKNARPQQRQRDERGRAENAKCSRPEAGAPSVGRRLLLRESFDSRGTEAETLLESVDEHTHSHLLRCESWVPRADKIDSRIYCEIVFRARRDTIGRQRPVRFGVAFPPRRDSVPCILSLATRRSTAIALREISATCARCRHVETHL